MPNIGHALSVYDVAGTTPRLVTETNGLPTIPLAASDGVSVGTVTGTNALAADAWGTQRVSLDFSLFHGMFTFGTNGLLWKKYIDGSEVIDGTADEEIYSDNGALIVTAATANRFTLYSKRHPKYQPNRGHKYSTAGFIRNYDSSGKLYHVHRKTIDGTTTETRHELTTTGVDLSKGNLFDMRLQWRGVGDSVAFLNLSELHGSGSLGTRDELSIPNPALPVMFEAVKGAHTIHSVARTGSAIRWGLATEENGVYYEFEYSDTRVPKLEIGCVDVTSEGGGIENRVYGSIASGSVTLGSDLEPVIVIRVPENRTVGLNTLYNTVDLILGRITCGQSDEHDFSVYVTRDSSAVTVSGAGQDWAWNWSNDVEYVINDNGDAGATVSFDDTKCSLIYQARVEVDQPWAVSNPNGTGGEFYITNGDYIIVAMDSVATGTDTVNVTIEWGAEK